MKKIYIMLLLAIVLASFVYAQPDITTGLILHLNFSANINDSSGENHIMQYFQDGYTEVTPDANNYTEDKDDTASSAFKFLSSDMLNTTPYLNLNTTYSYSMWLNGTNGEATGYIATHRTIASDTIYDKLLSYPNAGGHILYLICQDSCSSPSVSVSIQGNITDNLWHHIAVTVNSTNVTLYLDGAEINRTPTGGNVELSKAFIIGSRENQDFPFYGELDEIRVYNISLSAEQVSELFSPTVATVLDNDLILQDLALGTYALTGINESDEFWIMNNFTVDGDTDSSGICNFTALNISAHFPLINASNYTLTNSDSKLSLIFREGNTSIKNDNIEFDICRESLKTPLQIYVNGTLDHEIDQNIIPICGIGSHAEAFTTTSYNNMSSINLTLQCSDCNGGNRQLRIIANDLNEVLHWERSFTLHSEDMAFNATTELYEYRSYQYEYTVSGANVGHINITCNDTTEQFLFNIGSVAPTVTIISIDEVAYSDGMQIESNLTIEILIDVNGDVIAAIEFNVTYENGTIVKTQADNESMILTNDDLNVDGIYNISILGTDEEGNSTLGTGFFLINDTVLPTITWLNPLSDNSTSVIINENMMLNITVQDLNLFAYSVLVLNPSGVVWFNFSQTGISTQTASINDIFAPNLSGTWTINTTVTDDHTKKKIPDYVYSVDDTLIQFNFTEFKGKLQLNTTTIKIYYESGLDLRDTEVIKDDDRYKFKYRFFVHNGKETIKHKYKIECKDIVYRDNSPYTAHFVCPTTKNWLDFETENLIDWKLNTCGIDCYKVTIETNMTEYIEFNSLGGLNEVSELVQFSVSTALVGTNTTLNVNECPRTIEGQLGLWLLTFIILAFIAAAIMFRIPSIGFISSIGLLVLSWTLAGCQEVIAFIVAFVGLLLIIMFALEFKFK